MPTRLVFLEEGSPVSGVRVKRDGAQEEFTTDSDGQLSLPLTEGNQKLVVYHRGSWIPHVVRVEQRASLLLVDMKEVDEPATTKSSAAAKDNVNFLDVGKLNLGERYVYDRTLGRGGMGFVIRARDRLLNRSVAIKLLSEELQDNAEAQQIFLSEARHLATLSHPNLVAVHDISKLDDRVFMVIEYIKGETLERLITNLRHMSESVALKLAIQLTRVVAYLHDHGIIHRDLKPANAIVRHDGTLKLVDFGLARQFDELYIRGTRVRGTPAYMSPEQIKGAHLTPASDIYQLGVCFFEMLTGRLPFQKGDVAYAHVHEPAPRIQELRPNLNIDLCLLIQSCLEKDPRKRPSDAHEILDILKHIHRHVEDVELSLNESNTPAESTRGDSLMRLRLRTSELNITGLSQSTTENDMTPSGAAILKPAPRTTLTHLSEDDGVEPRVTQDHPAIKKQTAPLGTAAPEPTPMSPHMRATVPAQSEQTTPAPAPTRVAAPAPLQPLPEKSSNKNVFVLGGLIALLGVSAMIALAFSGAPAPATATTSAATTTTSTPASAIAAPLDEEPPRDEDTPSATEPAAAPEEAPEPPIARVKEAKSSAHTTPPVPASRKDTAGEEVAVPAAQPPKSNAPKAAKREAKVTRSNKPVAARKPAPKKETEEPTKSSSAKQDKRKGLFEMKSPSKSKAPPAEKPKSRKGLLPM